MWEESISPSELGWGTTRSGCRLFSIGPDNRDGKPDHPLPNGAQHLGPLLGFDQEIVGMIVTHGESFGLSHVLTVRENGQPVYRLTVDYAYMPCNDSIVSLHELRRRNYELHPKQRILTDEIVEGMDVVGALIMGHRYRPGGPGAAQHRRRAAQVAALERHGRAGGLSRGRGLVGHPQSAARRLLPRPAHQDCPAGRALYLGRLVSQPTD